MTSDTTVHEHEGNGKWNGQRPKTKPKGRAESFTFGRVRIRIWANPSYLGDVTWRVEMVRLYYRQGQELEASTFEPEDLWNVMRAAHTARAWIRRKERWLWLRRLFFPF